MRGGALRPVVKKAGIPKWLSLVGSGVIVAGLLPPSLAIFAQSTDGRASHRPVAADLLNDQSSSL